MNGLSANTIPDLVRTITELKPTSNRTLVAISGPPASGKSTLSAALCDALGDHAIVVPMDGFHLDNAVLTAANLLHRKGAPESFDLAGFAALIARLKTQDEVYFPLFDRTRDLSVAGAGHLRAHHQVVLIEGNYLLLNEPAWADLNAQFDHRILLDVPRAVLVERLTKRWVDLGLAPDVVHQRVHENDVLNLDRMLDSIGPYDTRVGT